MKTFLGSTVLITLTLLVSSCDLVQTKSRQNEQKETVKTKPETIMDGEPIGHEEAINLAKVHMDERKIDREPFKQPKTHKVKDLWVVTFDRKRGPATLDQGDYYKVYINAKSGEVEGTLTNE